MLKSLSGWPLGLAFNLLFWLAAVALDFPRTYWDDSVIIGPAISIAETGLLKNPYLNRSFYPGDVYLFYPPGFFWVLGGWIALFGRSILSLALFWAACGLVASIALAVLLQRLSGGRIAWAVAPVLVFGCIAYTGHRYEILAFATFFAGLALAVSGRRGGGYLLLILTPTIAPTFLALGAITVVAVFARHWQGRFWREAGLVVIGFTLACLTIIAGVGGDVASLLETMYDYRGVRVGIGGRDIHVIKLIAAVIGLNLLTAACWRVLAGQGWRSVRFQLPLLLALALALTLVSHARPALVVAMNIASITLAALALGDALAAWRWRSPQLRAIGELMPALGLAGIGAILLVLNLTYIRAIAIPPLDPGLAAEARALAAQTPATMTIVADPRVVKEALGFPTDRRVEDSMIRNAWPDFGPNYAAMPANERWITTRTALLGAVDPAAVPVTRGRLDQLFIAAGMGRAPDDALCRVDTATARSWDPRQPQKLVDAACPRRTMP